MSGKRLKGGEDLTMYCNYILQKLKQVIKQSQISKCTQIKENIFKHWSLMLMNHGRSGDILYSFWYKEHFLSCSAVPTVGKPSIMTNQWPSECSTRIPDLLGSPHHFQSMWHNGHACNGQADWEAAVGKGLKCSPFCQWNSIHTKGSMGNVILFFHTSAFWHMLVLCQTGPVFWGINYSMLRNGCWERGKAGKIHLLGKRESW